MTREKLRQLATDGIDAALGHPWIAGLTVEKSAALIAFKGAILADDGTFLDKVLARMPAQANPGAEPGRGSPPA